MLKASRAREVVPASKATSEHAVGAIETVSRELLRRGGLRATSSSTSGPLTPTCDAFVAVAMLGAVAITAAATRRMRHGAAHDSRSGATTLPLSMS
eukprot:jgi/Chrpa1/6028/Chrysochromulina_OHIO_Genome00013158-RA